jgi:ribose transport system substrate-binding protein
MRVRGAALMTAAVISTAVVVGCGSSDDSGSSTSGGSGSGGKAKKVVYVPGLTGNPFYSTVACGARSVAERYDVDFSVQGASTFDVARQTEIVNALTASRPDAIMISITDPKAMIAPLAQAKANGIKIIGIDGDLVDESIMVTNIQSSGEEGGKIAAQNLARLIGERGSVIAIDNSPGSLVAGARQRGFEDEIRNYPGIKYLGVKYSGNATARAASIVSTTATSNPDLAGVYTLETNNTEGALTGLREAGKTGKVRVIGYDTSPPIEKALADGTLDGTIVQYPFGEGVQGIESAVKAIDGEQVERNQGTELVLATPDNYRDPRIQRFIYKTTC